MKRISALGSAGPPDWVALVETADPGPFLQSVQVQLQSPQSHFKSVQQSLSSIFFKKVDPSRSLDFLLCCLEVLVLGADAAHPIPASSTRSVPSSGTSPGLAPENAGAEIATTALDMEVVAGTTAMAVQVPGNVAPVLISTAADAVSSLIQGNTAEVLHGGDGQQLQGQQARPAKDAGGLSGTISHLLLELLQQQQQQNKDSKRQQGQQHNGGHMAVDSVWQQQQNLAALLPIHHTRVLRLFTACCSQPRHARIALKVAQVFGVSCGDVTDPQALATAVSELLSDRVTITPGLGLVIHFQSLLVDLVDRPALFARLVAEGKEGAAEKWAAGLSRGDQVVFVETCIAADRLKAAARATRMFGLKAEFPDIEARYRRAALFKLASKRVWEVAATFAGSDGAMQMELLQQMVEAGEAVLADEYRKRFGLPPGALNLDPVQLAAQEAARAERYLPLELPPDAVLFVDGPAGLRAAAAALAGARLLGIDVEWRASQGPTDLEVEVEVEEEVVVAADEAVEEEAAREREEQEDGEEDGEGELWRRRRRNGAARRGGGAKAGGGPTRAALLQVATHEVAVLFDLPALCGDSTGTAAAGAAPGGLPAAALAPPVPDLDIDSVLSPLFGQGGALVLGFGLAGDLAKLASSYPHVVAFQQVGATLDLYDMWKAYVTAQAQATRPKNAPPVSLSARAFQAGLSTLAATLLGKPLDKAMQVSDWEARPLSPRQLTYAAQDAHVLLRLWDAFHDRLPEGLAERVAAEKTQTFVAGTAGVVPTRRAAAQGIMAAPAASSELPNGSPPGDGDLDDDSGGGGGGGGGITSYSSINGGGGGVDVGEGGSTPERIALGTGAEGCRTDPCACTTWDDSSKSAAVAAAGATLRDAVAGAVLSAAAASVLAVAEEETMLAAEAAISNSSSSSSAPTAVHQYKTQIKALTKSYGTSIRTTPSAATPSGTLISSTLISGDDAVSGGRLKTALPPSVAAALNRYGLHAAVRWISLGDGGVSPFPGRVTEGGTAKHIA
ncbi:hypothetical protein Vafri_8955 [Volvox africanus]|uniref:3'-5' exonuclease domain-containing protein n=1 Tax=Volvox africanus TaxID=51714 RepID=A0A8J4EZA1_9CHLO|nr:hypothetical protein Vafri_8955 [Volvox africanus]